MGICSFPSKEICNNYIREEEKVGCNMEEKLKEEMVSPDVDVVSEACSNSSAMSPAQRRAVAIVTKVWAEE